MLPLWIAGGAAIGGVLRYWCSGIIARSIGETFPWGTMFVNVTGSLLIGLLAELTGPDGRILMGSAYRQFLMVGVFGGFTTFSSWSLQTLNLVQDGEWLLAGANIVLSVGLCLLGVWLGHMAGVMINR
ncbi:MAG: fluoride efflux transporter CrcB [Rhodospirillales bacterium]|nr:fluoride efflux transporter CrcB [Rhodospirillales bacterium]